MSRNKMIWASVAGVVLAAAAITALVLVGTSAYGADVEERSWGHAGEIATPEAFMASMQYFDSDPTVVIRGMPSINGGSTPLYVVDNIGFLDPEVIENMTVLKDAASTSICGQRASHGVIIITGSNGDRYNGTQAVSFSPDDIEIIKVLKDASSTAIYGSRAANGIIVITGSNGDNVSPFVGVPNRTSIREAVGTYFSDVFDSFANSRYGRAVYGLFELYAADMLEQYKSYREGEPAGRAIYGDNTVVVNGVAEKKEICFPVATEPMLPVKNSGIAVSDDAYPWLIRSARPGETLNQSLAGNMPGVVTTSGCSGPAHVFGDDVSKLRSHDLIRFGSFAGSDGRSTNFTVDGANFNNNFGVGMYYGYKAEGVYN